MKKRKVSENTKNNLLLHIYCTIFDYLNNRADLSEVENSINATKEYNLNTKEIKLLIENTIGQFINDEIHKCINNKDSCIQERSDTLQGIHLKARTLQELMDSLL